MPESAAERYRAVVFVGPRASGKTTLGVALARSMGWSCADSDHRLADVVGMPAGQFLESAGEPAFRAREEEVVLGLLRDAVGMVLALGGGAVLSPATRAALGAEDVFVVHLDADPVELAARQRGDATERPALTGLPLDEEVATVRAAREPLYRAVASLRLDTRGQTVQEFVDTVLSALD